MLGTLFIIVLVLALIGAVALIMRSTVWDESSVKICPRCKKRALRKVKIDPLSPESYWECTRCGNDKDEFGNII